MGDTNRFHLMADVIQARADPSAHIADIASGKGQLQAALHCRGFRRVVSWDIRGRNAGPRRNYRYGLFDYRSAPHGYDLVVGMHPDAATNHIVCYALKHRVPFMVCPCCVLPSARHLEGVGYAGWVDHLARLADDAGFTVETITLSMHGRNIVLTGTPPILDARRTGREDASP